MTPPIVIDIVIDIVISNITCFMCNTKCFT
nr:MAG TPA_asm: hypothetical protein [Caudoviricetes sp.]